MAETILLKRVWFDGKEQDILINNGKFEKIADNIDRIATKEKDCKGLAIAPAFYNGHCHVPMVLLRGYADDMELNSWLNDYIWPAEAKMTADDIYVGTQLGIVEMIHSGTVFFNDMYWQSEHMVRATGEMGIRAQIGVSLMDNMGKERIESEFEFLRSFCDLPELVRLTVAPHAPYTVSDELYKRCKKEAVKNGQMIHTHLSETKGEVEGCLKERGCTPVQLMEKLGILDEQTILAHVVHTTDEEADILAKSQSVIVTNPASNMKLSSGSFHMSQHRSRGSKVVLGTDGASSNNNLSMIEEMKFAALLAKITEDPLAGPADYIYNIATRQAATAFGIDGGEIAEGRVADAILLDLNNERLIPNFNIVSNLVYSADSRCIDSVICNGRFVMENGIVPGEDEIKAKAIEVCKKFV